VEVKEEVEEKEEVKEVKEKIDVRSLVRSMFYIPEEPVTVRSLALQILQWALGPDVGKDDEKAMLEGIASDDEIEVIEEPQALSLDMIKKLALGVATTIFILGAIRRYSPGLFSDLLLSLKGIIKPVVRVK